MLKGHDNLAAGTDAGHRPYVNDLGNSLLAERNGTRISDDSVCDIEIEVAARDDQKPHNGIAF